MAYGPKLQNQTLGSRVRRLANETTKTAGGFLVSIFFKVLEKRIAVKFDRVDQDKTFLERWNALMISYLSDPKNAIPQNKEAISAARGNLTKELIKSEMTWKVFLKSMRLLQIVKIDFKFKFHLYNNAIIELDRSLNLGDVQIDEEFAQLLPEYVESKGVGDHFATDKDKTKSEIPTSKISNNILD